MIFTLDELYKQDETENFFLEFFGIDPKKYKKYKEELLSKKKDSSENPDETKDKSCEEKNVDNDKLTWEINCAGCNYESLNIVIENDTLIVTGTRTNTINLSKKLSCKNHLGRHSNIRFDLNKTTYKYIDGMLYITLYKNKSQDRMVIK